MLCCGKCSFLRLCVCWQTEKKEKGEREAQSLSRGNSQTDEEPAVPLTRRISKTVHIEESQQSQRSKKEKEKREKKASNNDARYSFDSTSLCVSVLCVCV